MFQLENANTQVVSRIGELVSMEFITYRARVFHFSLRFLRGLFRCGPYKKKSKVNSLKAVELTFAVTSKLTSEAAAALLLVRKEDARGSCRTASAFVFPSALSPAAAGLQASPLKQLPLPFEAAPVRRGDRGNEQPVELCSLPRLENGRLARLFSRLVLQRG